MPLISFRDIKLFKTPAQRPKTNGLNGASPEGKRKFVQRLGIVFSNPFVLSVIGALVLANLISYLPSKKLPEIKPGEIAAFDFVSPETVSLRDDETTAKHRAEADATVLPVYTLDPNVSLNTADKIRRFFAAGRDRAKTPGTRDIPGLQKVLFDTYGIEIGAADLASLESSDYPVDLEDTLIGLLDKSLSAGLLVTKSLFGKQETEQGFILSRGPGDERQVGAADVPEIREAKEKLLAAVNALDLPPRRKGLLIGLSYAFLAPNVSYNRLETETRKAAARASIETVFFTIKKGRVILRKGDEATTQTAALVSAINDSLRVQRTWLRHLLGTFLIFTLLLVTLWFYLKALASLRTALKYFAMMLLTLFTSLLLYKLGQFIAVSSSQSTGFLLYAEQDSYLYALPFQFGTILFAFLTTQPVALIFAILNGLMAGYLFQANFFIMMYCLIGGLAALYGIKYYGRQKRTAALKAGLFVVTPVVIFTSLTLNLASQRAASFEVLATQVFMAVIGGIASGAFAFVLLPIYENIFRFVTQTKLMELTNSESEVLRQLAVEAPGSYHHSLVVASLAEKAAEAIGLDPLLVKAGALYHDIGKVKMPDYFIENRDRRHDAHKDLTPSMSTLVIVNHVKEGSEIARKEKLPALIRDIIEQHHGNSLVRYFYQKAKEKSDPELHTVGEETYRYPGPPPQSKEAAVVMLADSVEAASRSLRQHKEEHLKRVIRDIFDSYLQDGQLDECAFSLKEMRQIAQSFLATLVTIYQPRIGYPGFDFEGRQKQEKSQKQAGPPEDDDDRGYQPPEGGSNPAA